MLLCYFVPDTRLTLLTIKTKWMVKKYQACTRYMTINDKEQMEN